MVRPKPGTAAVSEVTATITTPADGTLAVCLACKAELRTDWPGTLEAFRAWHQQHCGQEGGS